MYNIYTLYYIDSPDVAQPTTAYSTPSVSFHVAYQTIHNTPIMLPPRQSNLVQTPHVLIMIFQEHLPIVGMC